MKKIITCFTIMFSLIIINSSIYAAQADVEYISSKYMLKPGEEFYVDTKLVNSGAYRIISCQNEFRFEPADAFEIIDLVSLKSNQFVTTPQFTTSPYIAGLAGEMGSLFWTNNELIYRLKLKVNPNFKGNSATIFFQNSEIYSETDMNTPMCPLNKNIGYTILASEVINTKVEYKLDPAYIITIPEKIIASDTAQVNIPISGNVNLEPDKQVKITVSNGSVVLNRHKVTNNISSLVTGTGADSITANLKLGNNSSIISTDAVALFEYGTENLVKSLLSIEPIKSNGHKAGMYIGNIIFNLSLIDKVV